jgi:hypothetical protein
MEPTFTLAYSPGCQNSSFRYIGGSTALESGKPQLHSFEEQGNRSRRRLFRAYARISRFAPHHANEFSGCSSISTGCEQFCY